MNALVIYMVVHAPCIKAEFLLQWREFDSILGHSLPPVHAYLLSSCHSHNKKHKWQKKKKSLKRDDEIVEQPIF